MNEPNFAGVAAWALRESVCAAECAVRVTRQIADLPWWAFKARRELSAAHVRHMSSSAHYAGMAAEFQARARAAGCAIEPGHTLAFAVDGPESRTATFGVESDG